MTVGKVSTAILTDIANAIRRQNGSSTLYKPGQMAVAVAALDGTQEGEGATEAYKELAEGVLSSKVFDAIAAAIRMQNGLDVQYRPDEMAAAILALEWDVGLKLRALLLDDGTFEVNYLERRRSVAGSRIVQAFEVDVAGYASAGARPWDGVKLQVKKVLVDASVASAGIESCAYWFNAFAKCTEVWGFENLSGMTNATQMFASCSALESIYATSFAGSLTASSLMFYGCNRLVGGTDGFVPAPTSAGSVCKLSTGGVLTDPAADAREWYWAHVYADGGAVLTASATPDSSRELAASGRICANAKYQGLGFQPWEDAGRQALTRATFAEDMAGYSYTNLTYLFYSCTKLVTVEGLGNLRGVRSMRYAFTSCGVTEFDFCGFDPSQLTDLFYTFSGCKSLTAIYADADWELPAKGVNGLQCFYNCQALVGGNGTAWSSSNTGYAYMRIDREGVPGYLTVR